MISNAYDFILLFDVTNDKLSLEGAAHAPYKMPPMGTGYIPHHAFMWDTMDYVAGRVEKDPDHFKGQDKVVDVFNTTDNRRNAKKAAAYAALGLKPNRKGNKRSRGDEHAAMQWMCDHYWDVRVFGASMEKGRYPIENVRGPVVFYISESISPLYIEGYTDSEVGVYGEVPYTLYYAKGSVSAIDAKKSGMTESDLDILFEALRDGYPHFSNVSRGEICMRKIFIFKHPGRLFYSGFQDSMDDIIKVKLNDGVEHPRDYKDYTVSVDLNYKCFENGVEFIEYL